MVSGGGPAPREAEPRRMTLSPQQHSQCPQSAPPVTGTGPAHGAVQPPSLAGTGPPTPRASWALPPVGRHQKFGNCRPVPPCSSATRDVSLGAGSLLTC